MYTMALACSLCALLGIAGCEKSEPESAEAQDASWNRRQAAVFSKNGRFLSQNQF
jgi:hypothetical protein